MFFFSSQFLYYLYTIIFNDSIYDQVFQQEGDSQTTCGNYLTSLLAALLGHIFTRCSLTRIRPHGGLISMRRTTYSPYHTSRQLGCAEIRCRSLKVNSASPFEKIAEGRVNLFLTRIDRSYGYPEVASMLTMFLILPRLRFELHALGSDRGGLLMGQNHHSDEMCCNDPTPTPHAAPLADLASSMFYSIIQ